MVSQSTMAPDHQNDYALDNTMAADIKTKAWLNLFPFCIFMFLDISHRSLYKAFY